MYLHLNFWIATFQVCMDIIGGVPTSYDKCLISWTLVWNFIWICMYDIILSKTHKWLSVCTALLHIMLCGEWIYLQDCCWFSDTYGLFNFLIPGTSFYSAIESSSWLVSVYEEMVLTVFVYLCLIYYSSFQPWDANNNNNNNKQSLSPNHLGSARWILFRLSTQSNAKSPYIPQSFMSFRIADVRSTPSRSLIKTNIIILPNHQGAYVVQPRDVTHLKLHGPLLTFNVEPLLLRKTLILRQVM